MSDFDWTERFPDLRPVRTPPALMRVNGIGFGVYGSRDRDTDTGTYVTTYCFSFLFIPVFALTAYRIADAPEGGWYFVGRVPLSGFAKTWNLLLLLAAVCGAGLIGWDSYTHSTDYLAGRQLALADMFAANGQIAQAAPLYRDVAVGTSTHSSQAAERLKELLDDPRTHASLGDAAGVLRIAIDTRQRIGVRAEDLEERGLKLFDRHAENDPRGALALLDVLAPIAKDPKNLASRRRALLERLVARNPNDIPTVSELALLYEASNQLPRCEPLLMPLKDRLGDSEGARILGQILVRRDKFEDACVVLEPYTEQRLPRLQSAEQAYNNAMTNLVNQLKNGTASGFPYQRHKDADQAGKQAIIGEYLASRLRDDPVLKKTNETYQQARRVVPAVLDLGMVLLSRAQSRRDAAARAADLKKAEQVFLAIQNDEEATSKEYRLRLGQVYYWLGKHQEGRKKFDELLAAEQRGYNTLLVVSRVLREVGAQGEARALLEEAYNKEPDQQKKFQAAMSRAVMATDLDDKIIWLQRANAKDTEVEASLCEARAEKALREGKPAEAEPPLRQAIDLYAHMPENAAVLNNSALTHLTLYRVTGERTLLEKAETMLDKAVALAPSNSILMENAVNALLDAAVRDAIGNFIDLKTLKKSGSRSLLSYLYDDRASQLRLTERLRTHPATVKATSFLERLLILSPKNPTVYRQLLPLYEDQRNEDKLRDLATRLDKGGLDLSAEEQRTREFHAGKRDEKTRQDLQAQLDRYVKLVEATGKGPRGVTYAVAATDLVGLKMGLDTVGVAVDPEGVVTLAESAYAAAPSFATRGYLEAALIFRARHNLARKTPAFAAMVARTRRSVSSSDLIAVALAHDGEMRQTILADADVQRVLDLIRESCRKSPDVANEWDWAMLRADPQEGASLAKVIRADSIDAAVRALDVKLYPFGSREALRACWALQAAGKEKEGAAILKQCAARGVPMPELP